MKEQDEISSYCTFRFFVGFSKGDFDLNCWGEERAIAFETQNRAPLCYFFGYKRYARNVFDGVLLSAGLKMVL